VQQIQDDALKALDLKDVRRKLNEGLAEASERAQRYEQQLLAAEGQLMKKVGAIRQEANKTRNTK
jgi:hypothetical protein